MCLWCSRRSCRLLLCLACTLFAAFAAFAQNPAAANASSALAVRALEVHADATLGVTIVIFHQRDAQSKDALGKFLRAHSESTVEFQTKDGQRRPARLFRLNSCFGRGMLVFPSASARISPHDEFLLLQ